MNKKHRGLIICSFILVLSTAFTLPDFPLPEAWFKAGSKVKSYDMGTDIGSGPNGENAATIKSIDKKINGFGTLMQNSKPELFLGKRVRMSGEMKSKGLDAWAGFWFRVDQADSKKRLAFDNMSNRPVTGTTGWKHYEIVLDVPANASNLAFGALLTGTGQIWFTNIKFEVVDNSIPTTDTNPKPLNLNFEK